MISENKVKPITTRKTNKEKILDYLKENPKPITTSDLAETTGIDIKNISRYLKALELDESILREIVQDGKIRVVYISLKIHKKSNTTRKNSIKNQAKNTSQSPKSKPKVELKKKTPSISEKREYVNSKFIEEMGKELRLFGTTIPLDKKQEIVNWVFKNIQHLYDGVYNYRRIWKKRYERYLVKIPDSPVIGKYHLMGDVLEFIKEIKILKEKLENAKNGK